MVRRTWNGGNGGDCSMIIRKGGGKPPHSKKSGAALVVVGASAEAVPDGDENDRDEKDEGGDGVDFGSDAAAEAAPDFERESVFAAVEEKGDGNFVHGEGEDQQGGGDE